MFLLSTRFQSAIFTLILFYGVFLRISPLLENQGLQTPDAEKHFIAAEGISFSEPSSWLAVYRGYAPFALWNRLVFALTFHDPTAQRIGTVFLSLLLVYLVAKLAEVQWGRLAGIFAGYVTTVSPPLVENASLGLREPMLLLFWVGLYFILFVWKPESERERWRWVYGAILGWLAFLVRVDHAVALAVTFGFAAIRHRVWKNPARLLPGAGVLVGLFLLLLTANWVRFDDPFYFVDREKRAMRYWANLEFHGQPGFPTEQEYALDPRTGPDLTAWEYFTDVLGPRETASRFYRGYRSFFLGNVATGVYDFSGFPNQIGWMGVLTLVGAVVLAARREFILLLLIPLIVFSVIWTYHMQEERDFRYFLPAIPFAILIATEGHFRLAGWIGRIPHPAVSKILTVALGLAVAWNPWNHELARSFQWRVGLVAWVPSRFDGDPFQFGDSLSLLGCEVRKIGPLGLWSQHFDSLEAGSRFRVRTFWSAAEPTPTTASYRILLRHSELGLIGDDRWRQVTRKSPVDLWKDGQVVSDELEYLVYPRVPKGEAELIMEVEAAGMPNPATATLMKFRIEDYEPLLIDARNWG